jgi:hypothetical protein
MPLSLAIASNLALAAAGLAFAMSRSIRLTPHADAAGERS